MSSTRPIFPSPSNSDRPAGRVTKPGMAKNMTDDSDRFSRSLKKVIGGEHVRENHTVQIDGLTPGWLIEPGTAEEVAACLRLCSEFEVAVVPAGAMTWLSCGNPLRRADVILSLRRLTRIVEYSPPDLTVTCEAGLSLLALNQYLSEQRLWLPLDPPHDPGSPAMTLGAVAACGSFGSLRLGYGTPRDHVIGLRLAHIDGAESKSGGRVVKNVAGYDLNKLYVGSYGTLAVLTELTFKLRPLPEEMTTVLITDTDFDRITEAADWIYTSANLQPASLVLTWQFLSGAPEYELFIRFADTEKTVADQVRVLHRQYERASVVESDEAIWQGLNRVAPRQSEGLPAITLRLNVPIANTAAAFEKALRIGEGTGAVAYLGVGVVRVRIQADDSSAVEMITALRKVIHPFGGNLFIESAPVAVRARCHVWEGAEDVAVLMQGIKRNFDPLSLLNPGKFVAGI